MPVSKQRIERRLALRARRRGEHHVSIDKRIGGQVSQPAETHLSSAGRLDFLGAMKNWIERFNRRNKAFEIRRKAPAA